MLFLRHRNFRIVLVPVAVTLLTASGAGSLTPPGARPITGSPGTAATQSYIVVLEPSAGDPGTAAADHAQAYGAQVTHVYSHALRGYAATIPSDRVAALRANPDVQFVSSDIEVQATAQTTGTGVERVKAVNKTDKGTGVNVAVIDTGIDVNHPDLAANIVGGTNCSKGGASNYNDGNGHGTHVAGIIGALDNGLGVVGMAPQAKLWAVRVLDNSGSGSMSDVVCGIDFVDSKSPAKGGPITVANMSLGGLGTDDGNCGITNGDPMHQAICRAVGDGVTFVVAAGNYALNLSTPGLTFVPAAYDEAISVSALADSNGQPCGGGTATKYGGDDDFATFSNYATSSADLNHLIGAPGVDIYSTWKGGGYASLSGTSMASPHVAGAAALYIETHPGASPADVRDGLKATGEAAKTNFNSECSGGHGKSSSHVDSSGRHPEVVLRADTL